MSAEGTGDWAAAVRWWGRAVEHDPMNSHFVLHQMRAMSAIGDRANAVQAGDQHVRQLREEYGVEPDPAVVALIGQIQKGSLSMSPDRAARLLHVETAGMSQTGAEIGKERVPEGLDGRDRRPAAAASGPVRVPRWLALMTGVAALVAAVAAIGTTQGPWTSDAQAGPSRTAIAVLPFRNLTTDTAQAWFAAGLHDELLAQLAKVAALRVISSASVSGYQQTAKPLDQIGEELDVGSIVQGSVQVQNSRLRVIVQLLDPATGAELWAETYDRPLDDAFTVQSDIAQRVVSAVGVTLSRTETGEIETAPTTHPEAYLLYLQGLEYAGRPGDRREDLAIAQRHYERAIALDSSFALAHAALSAVHGRIYSRRLDASQARAMLQLREAQAAMRLAPDLPEARVAMALTYCCGRYGDRREADELAAAARSAPNDASLWGAIAVVQARLGNWDSVNLAFERARRLDPRNADLWQAQGNRLHCLRRYPEAIEIYRRAMLLAPDYVQPHISLAWSYILWQGQTDTLRAVLAGLPDFEPGGGAPRVGVEQILLLSLDRQPDSVLATLRRIPGSQWTSGEGFDARSLNSAWAHLALGDTAAALAAYDSATALLDSALRVNPDDASLHMARGMVMARVGRRADAIREVRWLERSDGYRHNQACPSEPEARALILAHLGETDSALAATERLLAGRSRLTAPWLRLDPTWDALRGDPRFEALLVRYADPMAVDRPGR
jgi:TolB-like protein/predicted Zn-dependent protease